VAEYFGAPSSLVCVWCEFDGQHASMTRLGSASDPYSDYRCGRCGVVASLAFIEYKRELLERYKHNVRMGTHPHGYRESVAYIYERPRKPY
jgi:hypothetical protein